MQQKIAGILFRKMPKLLEYRQKCIKTTEIQAGYKRNKTQYKMTKDGKTQLLYTGEEMKTIDGKITPEKTRQQEMSKDRGKIPKREMYEIDRYWTLDNYKAVKMLSNETRSPQKRRSVTKIQTQEEAK